MPSNEVEPTMTSKPTRPRSAQRTLAPVEDTLAAEARLLHRSRSALGARRFHEALQLAGVHARDFPRGNLQLEAQALRVRALCGLGRDADARRAAAVVSDAAPEHVAAHVAQTGCTSQIVDERERIRRRTGSDEDP
jgi:hypothetical protein